jgi:3-hydroxybutyryl-CoA dehydrogenase
MTPAPVTGPACVVGTGTMGVGIALVLARVAEVRLVARRSGSLENARARIGRSLDILTSHGVVDAAGAAEVSGQIVYTTSVAEGAAGSSLVIESIAEDASAKRALLVELEQLVGAHTVIATNTSALSIDELAAALSRPERFAGLHWLNPAEFVDLVELVPGAATDMATRASLRAWAEACGKTVVEVGRDVPGFIVNRLQYALLREAFALIEAGVCEYSDVDAVMKTGLGARWAIVGPFESLDLAGLDVYKAVAERLYPELSRATEPARAACELVRAGALGCKSGHGLCGTWTAVETAALIRRRDGLLLEISSIRSAAEALAGVSPPTSHFS